MVKKRDCRVELCRIIACIMVIAIHINLSYIGSSGQIIFHRLLWSCLCADAVSVFWLISGFFIYKKFNYRHIIKRLVNSICIPLFVVNILYLFFNAGGGVIRINKEKYKKCYIFKKSF